MIKRIFLAVCLGALLTACASYSHIKPGATVTVDSRFTIDPQIEWAKVNNPGTSGTLWTIDGIGLNELHFFTNIKSGDPLLKITGQRKEDLPKYNKTMLPNDVMELLASTLSRANYLQLETADLAPARFGSADGFAFNLAFATQDGLEMMGRAFMVQRAEELDVILFVAPAEYYFDRYVPIVNRAFATVQLVSK